MADDPSSRAPLGLRLGALLLMGMGGLAGLLAVVFAASAWLLANGPALAAGAVVVGLPPDAPPRLMGLSLLAGALGAAQLGLGWLALRGGSQLARGGGMTLAAAGAVAVLVAVQPQAGSHGPLVALLPGVVAYAWVVIAFARYGAWFASR